MRKYPLVAAALLVGIMCCSVAEASMKNKKYEADAWAAVGGTISTDSGQINTMMTKFNSNFMLKGTIDSETDYTIVDVAVAQGTISWEGFEFGTMYAIQIGKYLYMWGSGTSVVNGDAPNGTPVFGFIYVTGVETQPGS